MGPYLTTPITSKSKSNGNTKELRFTACDMQGNSPMDSGWRKTMEDSRIHALNVIPGVHVFGVFDGHGGTQTIMQDSRSPSSSRRNLLMF